MVMSELAHSTITAAKILNYDVQTFPNTIVFKSKERTVLFGRENPFEMKIKYIVKMYDGLIPKHPNDYEEEFLDFSNAEKKVVEFL